MNRPLRLGLWTLGVCAMLALAALVAIAAWIGSGAPHDSFTLVIDGEQVPLQVLQEGGWAVGLAAGLIAAVVVLVVVPLALLFGLGLPALVAGLVLVAGMLVVGLIVAVALSPLLLIGLGVWWLVRRAGAPPASTTMPQ